jgi:L-ascorbate metabolism protein UlaG (beta-lactamase superfamily)
MHSYDQLDLPTLQQIHDLRGGNVHFLVPLGNKIWFEETGIPTLHVTELDWWDEVTLPTQPGSDQILKFVCTPAQHKSGAHMYSYPSRYDGGSGLFFLF